MHLRCAPESSPSAGQESRGHSTALCVLEAATGPEEDGLRPGFELAGCRLSKASPRLTCVHLFKGRVGLGHKNSFVRPKERYTLL